ncbi:MAG: hypothetical protein QGH40_02000 [bacterium]|nr:hypothetical protein [bacterium]
MVSTMTYHRTGHRFLAVLVGLAFLGTLVAPGFQTSAKAEMTRKTKGKLWGTFGGAGLGIAVLAMFGGPITLGAAAIYLAVGGTAGYLLGGGVGSFADWFEKETQTRNDSIDRILRDDTNDM